LDPDTLNLIGILVMLVLAMSWHEAAHAWVADRLGDPTARKLGRVTLNPIKHLDPFLSLILPALMYNLTGFAFGGAKPVPINPAYFRHKSRDFMLVALAGPGSNLVLAVGFSMIYVLCVWFGVFETGVPIENPYGGSHVDYVPSLLADLHRALTRAPMYTVGQHWIVWGILINVLLAIFNLFPLPPLDGSRVIGWVLPDGLKGSWYGLDRYGLIMVFGFFFFLDGFSYIWQVLVPLLDMLGVAADFAIAMDPLT
jgi:Zn-dependent protease